MRITKNKGFSIVELIVAISILAILGAILVPSFIHLQLQARTSQDTTKLESVASALKSAANSPEVISETDDYSSSSFDVVFLSDKEGKIDVTTGTVIDGANTYNFKDSKIGLCSYQSFGTEIQLVSSDNYNKKIVFHMTAKTSTTVASCSWEVLEK